MAQLAPSLQSHLHEEFGDRVSFRAGERKLYSHDVAAMPSLFMPVMLDRVAERIPMPENMREQMPELMPKVMDNLMPHMIDDVVPLVTQPLLDHLRGRVRGTAA